MGRRRDMKGFKSIPSTQAPSKAVQRKVLVGILHTNSASIHWAVNFRQQVLPPGETTFCGHRPWDVCRNRIAKQALDMEEDLFFWDTDIILPEGAAWRLFEQNVPIVAGLYHFRTPKKPPRPRTLTPAGVALSKEVDAFIDRIRNYSLHPEDRALLERIIQPGAEYETTPMPEWEPMVFKWRDVEGKRKLLPWPDYPREKRLVETDAVPTGVLLIRLEVLQAFEQKGWPWFEWTVGREDYCSEDFRGQSYGEDVTFSLRALKLGYKLYVDIGTSCGHVSQMVVTGPHEVTGF